MNILAVIGADSVSQRTYFLEGLNNSITISIIRVMALILFSTLLICYLRYKKK